MSVEESVVWRILDIFGDWDLCRGAFQESTFQLQCSYHLLANLTHSTHGMLPSRSLIVVSYAKLWHLILSNRQRYCFFFQDFVSSKVHTLSGFGRRGAQAMYSVLLMPQSNDAPESDGWVGVCDRTDKIDIYRIMSTKNQNLLPATSREACLKNEMIWSYLSTCGDKPESEEIHIDADVSQHTAIDIASTIEEFFVSDDDFSDDTETNWHFSNCTRLFQFLRSLDRMGSICVHRFCTNDINFENCLHHALPNLVDQSSGSDFSQSPTQNECFDLDSIVFGSNDGSKYEFYSSYFSIWDFNHPCQSDIQFMIDSKSPRAELRKMLLAITSAQEYLLRCLAQLLALFPNNTILMYGFVVTTTSILPSLANAIFRCDNFVDGRCEKSQSYSIQAVYDYEKRW